MTRTDENPAREERVHADPGMLTPSPAVGADFLSHAIRYVKPHLDRSLRVAERLRALWAAVVAARDLAASDVVEEEFLKLAQQTELATDLGRHADDDLRHVVRWAMLNLKPFR
jgi:hypothetical protein